MSWQDYLIFFIVGFSIYRIIKLLKNKKGNQCDECKKV